MPNGANPWKLENFAERFDAWADLESPDGDLRCVVMAWVLTRGDDPYEEVRREPDVREPVVRRGTRFAARIGTRRHLLVLDQGGQPHRVSPYLN